MGPRVDSLSNYQVTAGQQIYAYGAGFAGATRVTVGDAEATHVYSADDVTIVFTLPNQPGGSTNWVVVTGADGSTSPCVGDAQLVTYLDGVTDQPRGALRLDSVTPSPIVAGRPNDYWLVGSGLSGAVVVMVEGHSCDFETHDDARLVMRVPAFRHDSGQPTVEVKVHDQQTSATLAVACVTEADATPPAGPPWVGHLDPAELPASGGRLVVHGGSLSDVTAIDVGGIDATIEEIHDDQVVISLGSLAGYEHQHLPVTAITPRGGTPYVETAKLHVRGD